MISGTLENPYPNCHKVLFNISNEYWEIIEKEYTKFKRSETYVFPKKPFGDSIISPEHEKAMKDSFSDLFKDMKEGKYF